MNSTRTDTWYITYGLIAANMVVFVVAIVMGDTLSGAGADGLILDAATWGRAIHAADEWWRVFTGGFLHHGLFHLAVNMYSLYILGLVLERAVGKAPFVAVYFASLVSGSFGALVETPDAHIAGASGAIFGLMGAFAAVSLAQGIGLFQTPFGPILVINLVISFVVDAVSLGGHVGGLIGGFLVGAAAAFAIRHRRFTVVYPVTAAVMVASASYLGCIWAASRWAQG